ncbi:HU family DNA-binding protein [Amnibacterium sp. CER49]|uniref:HU family DNA-binding protein n=1 Tax=Amnibacterium sp. CER49 TaxID=3039161 RepID=UPI002448E103|nr:HU family DNA-binding protein [Amnibacterium sp. CER49]MDH2443662.1 HU family DNA-binding protein [Amnibacterium sp. CER49]
MSTATEKKTANRSDLVSRIAAETGQPQNAVNAVLDALLTSLAEYVGEGTKVTIPGWLAVETTSRAARTGRNPQTGEPIEIAASTGVKISAGSKLKAAAK